MDFTSHDITVIEQALRIAMETGTGGSKQSDYREVLSKLQSKSAALHTAGGGSEPLTDGFRFDYDDTSDME